MIVERYSMFRSYPAMTPIILLAVALAIVLLGFVAFLMTWKKSCTCLADLTPEQRAKRRRDAEIMIITSAVVACFQIIFGA